MSLHAAELSTCNISPLVADRMCMLQGQSEDVSEQLNEEEQLLVISRLHQVKSTAAAVHFHLHLSNFQTSQLCSSLGSSAQSGVPSSSSGSPAASCPMLCDKATWPRGV